MSYKVVMIGTEDESVQGGFESREEARIRAEESIDDFLSLFDGSLDDPPESVSLFVSWKDEGAKGDWGDGYACASHEDRHDYQSWSIREVPEETETVGAVMGGIREKLDDMYEYLELYKYTLTVGDNEICGLISEIKDDLDRIAGGENGSGWDRKIPVTCLGKKYFLTKDEIYAAYRYQEKEFRTDDAVNHIGDLIECGIDDAIGCGSDRMWKIIHLDRNDCREIAGQFLEEYDCNRDENEQFEDAVEAYVDRAQAPPLSAQPDPLWTGNPKVELFYETVLAEGTAGRKD